MHIERPNEVWPTDRNNPDGPRSEWLAVFLTASFGLLTLAGGIQDLDESRIVFGVVRVIGGLAGFVAAIAIRWWPQSKTRFIALTLLIIGLSASLILSTIKLIQRFG